MPIAHFEITGGNRLRGKIRISGGKNAALPIMAAAILCEGEVILHDVPHVADVDTLCELLRLLGLTAERRPADDALILKVVDEMNCKADYEIVRTMRASICVLGPLLAKRHHALVALPGGCAIGDRPVDIHMRAMKKLGADVELLSGDISAKAKRLRGTEMFLGGPFGSSVLGTGNAMMAATLAEGLTVIEMAACEPEVVDLANFLNACGARITGQGTPRIVIEGVRQLRGCEYRIIPDRIEAGTFMAAAAITNGELTLENCRLDHLTAFIDRLNAIGVSVEREKSAKTQQSLVGYPAVSQFHAEERFAAQSVAVGAGAAVAVGAGVGSSAGDLPAAIGSAGGPGGAGGSPARAGASRTAGQRGGTAPDSSAFTLRKSAQPADEPPAVTVCSARRLEPVDVTTQPFPGFPTDLQAQLMALLCLADGNSIITEKIFPDRFLHVAELNRMGARLRKEGPTVIVQGVKKLVGAPVMASDLRASAALVLAGLCAKGTTKVNRIYHLERGYDRIDEKLRAVGAEIERKVTEDE